jgi:hypothetical protein
MVDFVLLLLMEWYSTSLVSLDAQSRNSMNRRCRF